jgi:exopolysaccharide production protein ExoQ
VIWVLLAGSRAVSQWWLDMTPTGGAMDQIVEGNPLERNIFSILLAMGLVALCLRRRKVLALLSANAPILLFFLYCGISVLWSDYPGVSFKRWIKALGDVVMVFIVLTDSDRMAAVKRFLARAAFLLVPVSVLLIKYYPNLGRAYNFESGGFSAVGVTSDKNMLGVLCLVLGLGAVWRVLHAFQEKRRVWNNRPLIAQGAIVLMVLWLFWKANSVTSLACFLMGSTLMMVTMFPALARRRALLHLTMAGLVAVAFSALFLHVGTGLVEGMGRDSTLTGRTDLWKKLLGMSPDPIFGAGFESFWMGPRLIKLFSFFHWHPNEAHNGYLEVFLNLGWTGVALLAAVIVTGYRNAFAMFRRDPQAGRLRLAYFLAGVVYAFTEAGFRMLTPIWIAFLLAVTAIPEIRAPRRALSNGLRTAGTRAGSSASRIERDTLVPSRN